MKLYKLLLVSLDLSPYYINLYLSKLLLLVLLEKYTWYRVLQIMWETHQYTSKPKLLSKLLCSRNNFIKLP